MRKLKLELDELAVESFETAGRGGRTGTVQGHSETDPTQVPTCTRPWESQLSCPGTCVDESCLSCITCASCACYQLSDDCHAVA